jgi:hypothetical protein
VSLARQDNALEIERDFFPVLFLAGRIHIVREEFDEARRRIAAVEAMLRPFHGDPRFTGLLDRMGLPDTG